MDVSPTPTEEEAVAIAAALEAACAASGGGQPGGGRRGPVAVRRPVVGEADRVPARSTLVAPSLRA